MKRPLNSGMRQRHIDMRRDAVLWAAQLILMCQAEYDPIRSVLEQYDVSCEFDDARAPQTIMAQNLYGFVRMHLDPELLFCLEADDPQLITDALNAYQGWRIRRANDQQVTVTTDMTNLNEKFLALTAED